MKKPATDGGPSRNVDQADRQRHPTKLARITQALLTGSLNRFEAEEHGDHCLNSTISRIQSRGVMVARRWERVPTRFGTTAKVLRYWIPPLSSVEAERLIENGSGRISR